MALSDVLALVVFVCVVGGFIYGIRYAVKQINAGVASTKETLKAKGVDVSATGVSMKTSKRFDRQDYLDATQRGFVNMVESSSLNKYLDAEKAAAAPRMDRSSSNTSDKRKKTGMFSSSSKKR